MLEETSDTVTVETGETVTVTVADPRVPSLAAVMRAVPVLAAVTVPVADTVATPELSDDQVIARPVRTWPLASLGVAVAVVVPPIATEGCARATERVAIGGGPVTPPPQLQPMVVKHNTIAVRTRSGSGPPLGLPRPAKGRGLNMEANQGPTSKGAADYRLEAAGVPAGGPPGPIGLGIPR